MEKSNEIPQIPFQEGLLAPTDSQSQQLFDEGLLQPNQKKPFDEGVILHG
jgi:hypothetical protein